MNCIVETDEQLSKNGYQGADQNYQDYEKEMKTHESVFSVSVQVPDLAAKASPCVAQPEKGSDRHQ